MATTLPRRIRRVSPRLPGTLSAVTATAVMADAFQCTSSQPSLLARSMALISIAKPVRAAPPRRTSHIAERVVVRIGASMAWVGPGGASVAAGSRVSSVKDIVTGSVRPQRVASHHPKGRISPPADVVDTLASPAPTASPSTSAMRTSSSSVTTNGGPSRIVSPSVPSALPVPE